MIFYSQEEFRKISTGILFLLITISDFFHLSTLIIEFLTVYSIYIFRNVFFQCRLEYFVENISRAMSTYFMVTIAIDRLIRSEYPMRSKKICTKRNVMLITIIYLIIFCLFWSFFLYPLSTQDPITGVCSYNVSASYAYFIANTHIFIRAVLVCFVPAVIMLLANIRMLMNIRQSRRRVTNASTIQSSETNVPLPNASKAKEKADRKLTALDRMLYYMMIANVSIFIITQLPFHIYSCIRNNLTGLSAHTALLIRAMLLIWSSLYFGVGFYFYCLASPLFRQKFIRVGKKIFCCQAVPRSVTNSATVAK